MKSSPAVLLFAAAAVAAPGPGEVLIFDEEFNTFNLSIWKHELTLSGEGNWEFEYCAYTMHN